MVANRQQQVAKQNIRKHTYDLAKHWLGVKSMARQAKTLNGAELRRVLDYVATRKHALRNRAMILTTYLSGMRVGELAQLRYSDVIDASGSVRSEIRLTAQQTKGSEPRTVFVSQKLRKELGAYASVFKPNDSSAKFFYSQKRSSDGYSANTLAQYFHFLYKNAGISGASSHSGRRTFITDLATKGVSVRVLMNLAGHKNIGTTQAYIDINDNMLRKAVELV